MARSDWNVFGPGGLAVIDETGSKRCQLTGDKTMLWNGRSNLINAEIIGDIKFYTSSSNAGALLLRSNATTDTCYRDLVYSAVSTRTHYIQKIVNGVVTQLGSVISIQNPVTYVTTRFRVDGYQLSVDEFINGVWVNILVIDDTSQAVQIGYVGIAGKSPAATYWVNFDNVEVREKT